MKSVVTQKDLAKAAGLDQSTISLALRGDPRVKAKTREQVLRIARQLGYRKDPMLTALASYRDRQRSASHHGTLAWLHDPRVERVSQYKDSVWLHYYEGAKTHAPQHGYKVERFEVPINPKDHRRLSDILYHRGIEGVFLPPQLFPGIAPQLDWSQFAAVTFGWSITSPRFHSLSPNHYHNAIEAVQNLRSLGYRRIGGAITLDKSERLNLHLWSHGVETMTSTTDSSDFIPIFRITDNVAEHRKALQDWFRRYRPDAVLVNVEHIDFVVDAFEKIGVRSPDDVGLALLFRPSKEKHFAGIYENSPYIGAAAVDLLVGTLRRREFGAPPIRRMLHVEGVWKSGQSIRKSETST